MPLLEDFYLVKQLRGIVYYKRGIEIEEELKWLKRAFKYRRLATCDELEIERFAKLKLKKYNEKFAGKPAIKSLLLASYYLVPLILLKEDSLEEFEQFVLAIIKIKEKLNDRELKRNLRLVNYSITDYCLEQCDKKEIVERDVKRFWRLKMSEEGKAFISYLDAAKLGIKERLFKNLVPALILDLS